MKRSLHIAVADDEPDMREYLAKILPRLGHSVVAVAENGTQLVAACRESDVDLVVTDIKMPELDGIEATAQINAQQPIPVILISAYHDPQLIERAQQDHILAYLVKPIKLADLETAITLAMRRFEQFELLQSEAATMRQALVDRKLIEQAKGFLMKRNKQDEQEAFHQLQKLASNNNQKLVDVARGLLLAEKRES